MNPPAGRPTVVCVDDEAPVLSALRRLLRSEPYEFLATEKPDLAVAWVLERKAQLMIADQRMPHMSGLQVLELVRTCSPTTVRVMLTGQSDLSEILKLGRIDAIDRVVRKPWEGEELKGLLRQLLFGSSG
jgi:response regulator RpfG family c-di-GMP phosphodiesterase